ncbi:cupin domain-containing protein [Vulcanococcus limneticus]|uniref:cupin domain-containing protein n=1 Tax=Vulcanococcus limneticus TaxID=2170428 RepID=UPI00398C0E35
MSRPVSRPRRVEILPLERSRSGHALFSAPRPSDETLIAEISPDQSCELFCHRRQTDQLMVLRGAIDLVVLEDRHLRRIRLREDEASWVCIPPGVPHGAINRGRTPAVVVNAVLRHGPSDPRDYLPRRVPGALLPAWRALAA